MKSRRPSITPRAFAAGLAICCGGALLCAQSDKVSLKVVPKPNSMVHYRMTVQMTMEAAPGEGGNSLGALLSPNGAPMRIVSSMSAALTQSAGLFEGDGRYPVSMTYDDFKVDSSLNGNSLPVPGNPLQAMIGKPFVVIFDADGQIAEIPGPPEGLPPEFDTVRKMVPQMMRFIPSISLAVGETATTQMNMTIPIPVPGKDMVLSGQLTTRLVSIDMDGGDRIAHCEQSYETSVSQSQSQSQNQSGGSQPDASIVMSSKGSGTLAINLDQAFVKSSNIEGTMDISMPTGANGGAQTTLPPMRLHGVMKTTMAGMQ